MAARALARSDGEDNQEASSVLLCSLKVACASGVALMLLLLVVDSSRVEETPI